MHGLTPSSGWTHLLPGFIVGGIGAGLVNAPLASTAVGVVEPRRAGMASGINNTFRQVGIATGIAGLGAIFQHHLRGTDRAAFVGGLNEILLVAAIVAFIGAAAGLALVRGKRLRQNAAARRGLIADADLPRRDQQDHGGAGDDDERLSRDREGERLRLRHAGERKERRAGTGLHRSAGGADRHRRRSGGRAEEAERERERAAQRERVQEQEDRGAAQRPRDGDQEQRGKRLLAALRVLARASGRCGTSSRVACPRTSAPSRRRRRPGLRRP